jgi:hypothetical protein
MSLLPPQSSSHMSPFSPFYSGRDFTESVDGTMGTPPWENDVSMHFTATGMSPPFVRLQPEVTPPDLNYPLSHSAVDDHANHCAVFEERGQRLQLSLTPDDVDMQGGSSKGIATPFTSCDVSEADDTRTVVTGSGPNRARLLTGLDKSKYLQLPDCSFWSDVSPDFDRRCASRNN